jgi:hypothetical protein
LKSQVVADKNSRRVICTAFCNDKKHDFRLYKESKMYPHKDTKLLTDSGYQGIKKMHANTEHTKKKSKKNSLTKDDKKHNQELSRDRVDNENVIGKLKRFKIIFDKYRNRRKRFGVRFNLIVATYNWELQMCKVSKEIQYTGWWTRYSRRE